MLVPARIGHLKVVLSKEDERLSTCLCTHLPNACMVSVTDSKLSLWFGPHIFTCIIWDVSYIDLSATISLHSISGSRIGDAGISTLLQSLKEHPNLQILT